MEVVGRIPKSTVITENESLLTIMHGDLREFKKALMKMVCNSSKWTVIYKSGWSPVKVDGDSSKWAVIDESFRTFMKVDG